MSSIEELNKLMKVSAKDAIEYIRSTYKVSVTIRREDLTQVDKVLTKLSVDHIQTPLSDADLFTVCNIMGAFVGELFKGARGGEWFMDESLQDAPFVVLNYAGKSFPFASICYEKIVKQPEISIAKYYDLAVGGSTQ